MRYVFGDCTLDTQLYVLHRGARPIPLRAKVFQVLHYLLAHGERVISKQERAEAVVTLATEQGFALWAAQGMMMQGWALVRGGGERRA